MKTFVRLLIGGAVYYLIAISGMIVFSFQPSNITVLWLPFAFGVILIHYFGFRAMPFILLASFLANLPGMVRGPLTAAVLHTSISALADTMAPALSAFLLRKYVDDRFESIKGFLPFTVYGVLVPTFFSSVLISLNLWWGGYIISEDIFSYVFLLVFVDGLGLFLLYPIYRHFTLKLASFHEWKEIIVFSLIVFSLVYLSSHVRFLIFLYAAVMVMLAFRVREDYVAIILLISVIELIYLAGKHQIIFQGENQKDSLLMLMSFISSVVFIVMGITQHQRDLIWHQHRSITDVLTQTHNRLSYKTIIEAYIDEFNHKQRSFSILLFDIDNFKSVNDTYGHYTGDRVLADLSFLLQTHIRSYDSLFRIGGEEFVILLPDTSLSGAVEAGEKLRKIVEAELNSVSGKTITISMGITEIQSGDTEATIYRRVDGFLYTSKQRGKNCVTSDADSGAA